MGAFFTNIQLRTSDFDRNEITQKVAEYLTRVNVEAGFIKVDSEEEADKTVIISPAGESGWLFVYDEEMEDQGSSKLNKLASGLSKEFKTTALSVLVHDSDSMYLGVNTNGTRKDSLSNLSKEIDFNKSKPGVWTKILVDNFTFDDIKLAWQSKKIFVENFLTRFAGFTGLDHTKLLTGYNYIQDEDLTDVIKLNFIQKDKKKTAPLGPTKFSMLAGSGLLDIKEGEKKTLEWTITNNGTFSNGLDIVIAGECIEKGLVIPENVRIHYVKSQPGKKNEFTASFYETVATTGEKIFYAKIEDIYIPKGYQPTYPMSPKEGTRYLKISYDCAIRFNISFIGGKDQSGDLTIFFSPLVNRQEGSYCAQLAKETLEEWIKKKSL